MPDLPLTLACWDYDRTRPLLDGRVRPEGIDLQVMIMRPREAFRRMLVDREFDVSEMSLAPYLALKARGDSTFVAIPVALSKIFRHSCIYVRSDAGIREPADLKRKRVGTTQYGATGAVYMRGMLEHDYGVRPEDVHWFSGRLNEGTEPFDLIRLNLPPEVRLDTIPAERTLEDLLANGELDALMSLYMPRLFEGGDSRVSRLFSNYRKVEQDYYQRTGIFPITHTVVIRADVHEREPWIAGSLYRAFCEARDLALAELYDSDALRVTLPWLLDYIEASRRVFGRDFWSYGLEGNRPSYEALAQYMVEQDLAVRAVSPEELFVAGVGS
jgi:4,5-dihydroxyphthalate decarboxylase